MDAFGSDQRAHKLALAAVLTCALSMAPPAVHAQAADAAPTQPAPSASALAESPSREEMGEPQRSSGVFKDLWQDQQQIWTSPIRLRSWDATWLVPLGGITAGLFTTDAQFQSHRHPALSSVQRYHTVANGGTAALLGVAGGLYLWGASFHDDHKREAGYLTLEAAGNTLLTVEALKYAFGRQRPFEADGQGRFFQGGGSFPSTHSAIAWSAASVLAHEYPGPLTRILAYGGATAVSLSRIESRDHFPSDVLVGAVIGTLVAQNTFRRRHQPDVGGSSWESASEQAREARDEAVQPGASPSVPLESWIYPAVDRLIADGYVSTGLSGMKPWTRAECARLVDEAREAIGEGDRIPDYDRQLVRALAAEFAEDAGGAAALRLDSIYERTLVIAGPALTDGFHFGQTISYDFGRPFQRGANVVAGAQMSGQSGPWFFSVRAEYQHAPSAPPLTASQLAVISAVDVTPLQAPQPFAAVNRAQLLDAYVGFKLGNWQVSFGPQSLSWGPGPGGSMLLSDNALPLTMLRISNAGPTVLPSLLRFLGPVRSEHFVGRAQGHAFIPHPYIYGDKISFKPLPFFEIGFGRTVILGGRGGDAFTAGNFYRSFFGLEGALPGPGLPGDSRSQVDWTLRVPGLRNYLVIYSDMSSDDDEMPWINPPRATFRPGLYLTRVPGIPRMDFHFEYVSSISPGFEPGNHGNLNYWNSKYRDGYTNDGFLMANTIGRMGEGAQAWLSYSFAPQNVLQLSFKKSTVDADFIPGGGSWQDYSIAHQAQFRGQFYMRASMQYEHIGRYPLLFAHPVNNVSLSMELGITGRKLFGR